MIVAGTSTIASSGRSASAPAVEHVDDLHVAPSVVERRDQLGGRLGVEGAAAALEQLRLRVELGFPVQLEQLPSRCP